MIPRPPRTILIAVTGLSPQVVTETIWALARRDPPWWPQAVVLLTTRAGALAAEAGLPGAMAALAVRLGCPLPPPEIEMILDQQGRPIDDIATDAGNTAAADAIATRIRAATAEPDTTLHVSVAGGRKTQGCLAAMAMVLFGRQQDRLSHVLVPEPLARRVDFWFPPSAMREDPVVLADIPFVRLRGLWRPDAVPPGYGAAIAAVQAAIASPQLSLDRASRAVGYGLHRMVLPPQLFGLLAWLAEQRLAGRPPVTWRDIDPRGLAAAIAAAAPDAGSVERLAETLRTDPEGRWLAEKVSRLNGIARRVLGPEAAPYLIRRYGSRPRSAYALATPPQAIRLSSSRPEPTRQVA